MKGIAVQCDVLYFATFRKPASTSLILTYPLPPFTTIRGLLANALGHQQHDYSLQEKIKIGIRVLDSGSKNVELAKILKLKDTPRPPSRNFPSAPMFKEYIVSPRYELFIAGQEQNIEKVRSGLLNPQRPLYLGQSDDLVEVDVSEIMEVEEKKVDEFQTVVDGIYPGCLVEKVPYAFDETNGKYTVEYKVVSIPVDKETIEMAGIAYDFKGLNVFLF